MDRLRQAVIVVILLICALHGARVHAQDQGVAVITSPLEGAIVSGIVPILGAATHPQFQRYELAFGYSPNSTDTWFPVQDPATSQVVNDILGRWDTSGITDGVYTLRLRVYWSDQAYLEAFARNVQVENATPTPAVRETATAQTPSPLPTLEGTAPAAEGTTPQPLIALPPTSTPRPTTSAANVIGGDSTAGVTSRLNAQSIRNAFLDGVRLTLIIFVLLGAYTGLRAALRSRLRR